MNFLKKSRNPWQDYLREAGDYTSKGIRKASPYVQRGAVWTADKAVKGVKVAGRAVKTGSKKAAPFLARGMDWTSKKLVEYGRSENPFRKRIKY